MPINKERCGPARNVSAQVKRPTPSGPEQYSEDGTANTGAVVAPPKHPDFQGPGKVITPNS